MSTCPLWGYESDSSGGGAFGTKIGGGGVPDLMHFDLGGSRGRMVPEHQFPRLKLLPEKTTAQAAPSLPYPFTESPGPVTAHL
jgi:hypothetical protein